jgi:hypothetical protein
MDAIADCANIMRAFCSARLGKTGKGEVRAFGAHLWEETLRLRGKLLDASISFGPYQSFEVYDPKQRTIRVAPFRDRVCHHALMHVCEPVLERYLIHDTYACRKEKGVHKAVLRAQEYARRYTWYLKMDVRKYYDSVDHVRLMTLLARRFKDRRLLAVFAHLIDSYETQPGKGLPIGNLTSQHFANHYLGALDHYVKEELGAAGYARYMDDFVIWDDDKERLKIMLTCVQHFLGDARCLTLKDNVQLNMSARGMPFLGYRVFHDRIGLTPHSKSRFVRKLRRYDKELHKGTRAEEDAARRVQALCAFVRFADTGSLRAHVLRGLSEGLEPRDPRRQLEQQRQELPVCEPQQQQPGQRQQQQRLPLVPARNSPRKTDVTR